MKTIQKSLWIYGKLLLFGIVKTKKKTKRLSPYSEAEIWDKDEFLSKIKYEQFQGNKAALALLWDLDARPHEIT